MSRRAPGSHLPEVLVRQRMSVGSRFPVSASITAAFALSLLAVGASAQTRPNPALDPVATRAGSRPIPGPVYEPPAFTRAVARGTRTRSGQPGLANWVQHARYSIDVALDPGRNRVEGRETITYLNRSPDSLRTIMVHLRQNVFAEGTPRRQAAPITGGVTLGRVSVGDREIVSVPDRNPALPITAPPGRQPRPGQYAIDGTVMTIPLAMPLLPGDSVLLSFEWSYTPPPAPADGREGHEDHVWFMGFWYPQVAVYDDVDGWVADPYLLEAEFYMDPADYDVRITVPHGWLVGATGSLGNGAAIFTPAALDSLALARHSGHVVRMFTPGGNDVARVFRPGGATTVWHFTADNVRDFSWGTSDEYAWDATRALITGDGGRRDTVDIHSFFRLTEPARAWRIGGARYTRDAIEQLSAYLWPYPWPTMTSMEGVLDSGGMEYPMMTLMTPWADTLSLAGDLMHETGHMWFPMQVGSNETRFPWMDEGLTQFDVAQAMRVLYGEPRRGGRPNDSEPGQRGAYLRSARMGLEAPLMLSGDDYPQDLYFTMLYNKTAQVLVALRGVMGEDAFHRAYVDYGRAWVGRHPQPYDFFNALSAAAGRDLSWFWRTWFYETWPLDQAIENVAIEGDSVAITVGDRGLAPMPVILEITREDGSVQRATIPVDVWLTGARETVFRVGAEPAVTRVRIDPDALFPDIDTSNQEWTRRGSAERG